MAKTIKMLTLLATVMLMSSFTKMNADHFIGTYSVAASDPAQIKLILNADHTYYYQDFSISDKKIVAKGNWKLRGNKVVLNDNDIRFHNVWTFEKNGAIAKSRKGFTFYKLCKIDQ
jgi:hypothetical protein